MFDGEAEQAGKRKRRIRPHARSREFVEHQQSFRVAKASTGDAAMSISPSAAWTRRPKGVFSSSSVPPPQKDDYDVLSRSFRSIMKAAESKWKAHSKRCSPGDPAL